MDYKLIDNFLPKEEFKILQEAVVFNPFFEMYLHNEVARPTENEVTNPENWYATHLFYIDDVPTTRYWDFFRENFLTKLKQVLNTKSLIRGKVNFYPYTRTLVEHPLHSDCSYSNTAVLFCLNTCDGYTKFFDGDKVESIENRLYFFDGSLKHCSTTTSNTSGRYNLSFNFL